MTWAYTLSGMFAIVALAGLGLFVFERERGRRANRLLGASLLSVAGFLLSDLAYRWLWESIVYPLANLDIYGLPIWLEIANRLTLIFASVFPALLLHFTMEFPRPHWLARTRYLGIIYLPGLLMLPFLLTQRLISHPGGYASELTFLFTVWQTWLLLYLLASLVALFMSLRIASGRIERQQTLFMLAGLAVPFVALPIGWWTPGWTEAGWGHMTWIFTAAMLSYAIARYRLLDIRVVVRKALAYSLLTGVVTLFYLAVVLAVNLFSAGLTVPMSRLVNALLIVGIAVLFAPTKERAQDLVDRLFFRGEIGRQELLQRLSRELHAELTEEKIVNLTLLRLTEMLDATVAYMMAEQGGEFALAGQYGKVPPRGLEQRFHKGDDLIHWLAAYQEGATVEQMRVDPRFGTTYVRSWARLDTMDATMVLPLLDGDGTLIGVVFVGRSRSGRAYTADDVRFAQGVCNQATVALENARLHQRASEAERLAALGRMASAIIHDLRTPIGGMMRCVEALGQEELPKEARDRLARSALEMMNRLYRMAQQVLDYTRGEWTVDLQPVHVGEFIEELRPVLEMDMNEHGIRLHLDVADDCLVMADTVRMSQVVYNLASNARDAMPNGGMFTIGARRSNGEVQLTFADTGVGIPAERLQRIFEPFVSYKSDRGTGLGLAICRKIMEDHGGSIRVESQVGVGSTFAVTLPCEPRQC